MAVSYKKDFFSKLPTCEFVLLLLHKLSCFFLKLADINDASTGSLSSYAYLLMMIYYLQHTSPPVLPCLQDVTLLKQGEQPVRIENEMNTWYQEDLDYVVRFLIIVYYRYNYL